jgi:hypothetical protein
MAPDIKKILYATDLSAKGETDLNIQEEDGA